MVSWQGMQQSIAMSFVEAATNILVGYALAVWTQTLIFPIFGIAIPLSDNLLIGGIFTCVSLLRSFALRRMFEAVRHDL
jgi:hypothetical protein